MNTEPTIFEYGKSGRQAIHWPSPSSGASAPEELLGKENLRTSLPIPEVSEVDVVRHFIHLSSINYGIDTGFYPLGSCTMKHNPKINEEIASISGFTMLHPYQDEVCVQGMLQLLFEMQEFLKEISGMDAVTLQPAAGAQGEFTALMIFKRHHERVGEGHRNTVLVPDSSHGTNPATAARCGYQVRKIPSGPDGLVDVSALETELSADVAAFMLTNPNTLGLFEKRVLEISQLVHEAGALMYCDGANMNAVLGLHQPASAGFDAMHFNLHKTFAGPHGGGGPGSGPVAVKSHLSPYLPVPVVVQKDGRYTFDYDMPESVGRVHSFSGNVGVIVRAYAYILALGASGLRQVSRDAVLNANYLLGKVHGSYEVPYGSWCMHEFVVSAVRQKKQNVRALDIAKRLIDYGMHPPTMYFPLTVPEAMMIEPTETESIETLDAFAEAMLTVAKETEEDPDVVRTAPHTTVVGRLDETEAARKLELRWIENGG